MQSSFIEGKCRLRYEVSQSLHIKHVFYMYILQIVHYTEEEALSNGHLNIGGKNNVHCLSVSFAECCGLLHGHLPNETK